MDITFKDGQVMIPIQKAVLVLTKAQFIEALKRGKAYRRTQARQARHADTASADSGLAAGGRGWRGPLGGRRDTGPPGL
jgi:hypothetical protein